MWWCYSHAPILLATPPVCSVDQPSPLLAVPVLMTGDNQYLPVTGDRKWLLDDSVSLVM